VDSFVERIGKCKTVRTRIGSCFSSNNLKSGRFPLFSRQRPATSLRFYSWYRSIRHFSLDRCRAKTERLKRIKGLLPESQGQNLDLAKARIWSCLSHMCRIISTAVKPFTETSARELSLPDSSVSSPLSIPRSSALSSRSPRTLGKGAGVERFETKLASRGQILTLF